MAGQGYNFSGEKANVLRRKLTELKKRNQLDCFAEALAEGMSIKRAGIEAGASEIAAQAMFMRLCQRWQQGIGD